MHKNPFSASHHLTFIFLFLLIFSFRVSAQFVQALTTSGAATEETTNRPTSFVNPVIKTPNAGCAPDNLRNERFVSEMTSDERSRLCLALNKITHKLNQTIWSPALAAELRAVWQVFSIESVTLRPMPPKTSPRILAMAEPFPDKTNADKFAAAVYARAEKSDDASFFQTLFHELRHVLDFYETWKNKTALSSTEIERRAYLLMSELTRETPERETFSGVPKFWKESWRKLSEAEISAKREATIQKYLRGKKLYRDVGQDSMKKTLDYSHLKTAIKSDDRQLVGEYEKKKGERLPTHDALPPTVSVLAQNIRESGFNLEKPKNPHDSKEILRVALNNEKKLYYGMSNFVYDQKLAFQCLKEGRVSASFAEDTTVTRTGDGNALFKLTSAPAALPCVLNYADLKTDFTNTFWASPALEKLPIYFSGFHQVDGVTLAHYTVLQPDARRFAELAGEYPNIKPFRVIVGTIYVSPEDGQIVRFAGTSFPEEKVTGDYARKVRCTYWVKAVRQKIDVENGLWVTVHVGTVAVASVNGKIHPFNYTVKFENYRQSETEVKILDDEIVAKNVNQ